MVPEFDPRSNEKVMLMASLYYKIAILNETGIILYIKLSLKPMYSVETIIIINYKVDDELHKVCYMTIDVSINPQV